jgi:hypothetical protein
VRRKYRGSKPLRTPSSGTGAPSARKPLTLNLLTTNIVAPPSNASKWQMVFNSAFKGLNPQNGKMLFFFIPDRIPFLCLKAVFWTPVMRSANNFANNYTRDWICSRGCPRISGRDGGRPVTYATDTVPCFIQICHITTSSLSQNSLRNFTKHSHCGTSTLINQPTVLPEEGQECAVSGSRRVEDEICARLWCDAAYGGNSLQTFRDDLSVTPPRVKRSRIRR